MTHRLMSLVCTFCLVGCGQGEEGPAGPEGPPGPAGESCSLVDNMDGTATITCDDGSTYVVENGEDGDSCSVTDNMDGTATIACTDGTMATVSDGEDGMPGAAGTSCTVTDNMDGTAAVSCDDGSSAVIANGTDGSSCTVADNMDGTATVSCDDGSSVVVSDGADGQPGLDGTNCSVTDNMDGTATIACDDGTATTIASGADGTSCSVTDNMDGTATISCTDGSMFTVSDGADGQPGLDGTSCSVIDNMDGTATVSCDDGSMAVIADGTDGTSCSVADNMDGTATVSCDDGTNVVISDGEDGADAAPCSVSDNMDGTHTISCPDGSSAIVSDGATGPTGNSPPSVDAGGVQFVWATDNVELTASAVDSDGTVQSYAWSQTTGTSVMITGTDTATASFDAPDSAQAEHLQFVVTVIDDDGASASDTVSVVVEPNAAPVAQADLASTPVDTAVVVDVLANDSDTEGASLTVVSALVSSGTATASVNGDESLTITPTSGGEDQVVVDYAVEDDLGRQSTSSVFVTVKDPFARASTLPAGEMVPNPLDGGVYMASGTTSAVNGFSAPSDQRGALARVDEDGNVIWVRYLSATIGGTIEALAVGLDGTVAVAATARGSVGVAVGASGFTTFSPDQNAMYLIVYEPNGDLRFAYEVDDDGDERATAVAVLDGGGFALGGTYGGGCPSEPCDLAVGGTTLPDPYFPNGEIALLTFSATGAFLDARYIAGGGTDSAEGLAAARDGGFFVAGYVEGPSVWMDGSTIQTDNVDMFISKYDETMTREWLLTGTAVGNDRINRLASGTDGRACFLGSYSDVLSLGGDVVAAGPGSAGMAGCVSADGSLLWSRFIASELNGYLVVRGNGNAVIVENFSEPTLRIGAGIDAMDVANPSTVAFALAEVSADGSILDARAVAYGPAGSSPSLAVREDGIATLSLFTLAGTVSVNAGPSTISVSAPTGAFLAQLPLDWQ